MIQSALDEAGGGGKALPFDDNFATLSDIPNVNAPGSGWYHAINTHQAVSYQHDLGNTGHEVKIYIDDGHNQNFSNAAIVSSNFFIHSRYAAKAALNGSDDINQDLMKEYLRRSRK